jgi:hypothetical protein
VQPGDEAEQFLSLGSMDFDIFKSLSFNFRPVRATMTCNDNIMMMMMMLMMMMIMNDDDDADDDDDEGDDDGGRG